MANVWVQVLLLGFRYASAGGAPYNAGLSLSAEVEQERRAILNPASLFEIQTLCVRGSVLVLRAVD